MEIARQAHEANVELVAKGVDAYNRGDLDGLLNTYAPDVECVTDARALTAPMRGRDAVRASLEDLAASFDEGTVRWTTSELFEIDGRVVHRGEWGGRGSTSSAHVTQSLSSVYSIRDGWISRIEWFFDHAEALKAVGLTE